MACAKFPAQNKLEILHMPVVFFIAIGVATCECCIHFEVSIDIAIILLYFTFLAIIIMDDHAVI